MVLLAPDTFLNELHKLFERSKGAGTIFVTVKRSHMKPRKTKNPEPIPEEAYKCLVRASDGKKHVSTNVSGAAHAKFAASMNVIMKAHMDALKKKAKPPKADKATAQKKTEAD
ncbi:signal recognition particle, SRP9/SRP14 subunit [Haematococcus lacustris]